MREIVFDTETTGLYANSGDRVTEIGCVEVIDFIPTGRTWHTYVNPQRSTPKEVIAITGLTDAFLSDKPLFSHVAEEFVDFIGDASFPAPMFRSMRSASVLIFRWKAVTSTAR